MADGEKVGSITDQIVLSIRDGVFRGRYAPGQRLIEADLTEEFGVSRGPIREAVARLVTDGLLETLPHKGARVRRYSPEELVCLFEVREVLEGLAAREAAPRVKADQRLGEELSGLHEAMGKALEAGRLDEYQRLNVSFHDAIVSAAANPILTRMLGQLRLQAIRILLQSRMNTVALSQSHQGHADLLARLLAGDGAGAEVMMRRHIGDGRSELADPKPALVESDLLTGRKTGVARQDAVAARQSPGPATRSDPRR